MTYFYCRPNGQVVMKSEKKIETDLIEFEYDPTPTEKQKIRDNWVIVKKDNTLQFELPEHLVSVTKKQILNQIKEDLENGTTTKAALLRLIELI